jgi:dihydroorotate dehydrogenase
MIYRSIVRPLAFVLPAEAAHHLGFGALRAACAVPFVRPLLSRLTAPPPSVGVRALGLTFPSPVGLAAGFDKDAVGVEALTALGFGFVEVGTVTLHAQPGNPRPRLFRLPADEAVVNRMGFNNHGADAMVARLSRLAPPGSRAAPVGVNVGKRKVVPEEEAASDFAAVAAKVAPYADYLVVNVSSPNTPGLRDLQAVAKLEPILRAVQRSVADVGARAPLLVKIAPDLAEGDLDAVCDLATSLGLAGIVATNTTISRDGLQTPSSKVVGCGAGGLSGAPLRQRSLAVLERVRARVGDRLVLIAAGGIATAEHARERLAAGATLVQLYTSFVYEGPLVASRIARGLAARDAT